MSTALSRWLGQLVFLLWNGPREALPLQSEVSIAQPPDGARVSKSLTWLSRWLAPLVRRWLPHRWSLQSDLPGSACLQMGHLETKESEEQVRSPVVIRPCVASAPSHDFLWAMDVISKNKPHPHMGVLFNILANIRQNWGGGWELWGSARGPGYTRADEIRSSGGGIQESTWLLNFPGKVETGNASHTLTGIWIMWECVDLQTDCVGEEDSRGTGRLSYKVLVAAEAASQLPTLWVSGPLEEGISPGSWSFDHLSTPGFEHSYICFLCTTGRRYTVGGWKTAEHEGARKDLRDSTLSYGFWGRGFKEAGLCSQQLGGILLWAFNTYCLTSGRKEAGFGKKPWSSMKGWEMRALGCFYGSDCVGMFVVGLTCDCRGFVIHHNLFQLFFQGASREQIFVEHLLCTRQQAKCFN